VDANSGDGWSLCTQNFHGCTPLATSKSLPNTITFWTGIAGIVPSPTALLLGVFAEIMGLIAADPQTTTTSASAGPRTSPNSLFPKGGEWIAPPASDTAINSPRCADRWRQISAPTIACSLPHCEGETHLLA
jgi:hypothetical protein